MMFWLIFLGNFFLISREQDDMIAQHNSKKSMRVRVHSKHIKGHLGAFLLFSRARKSLDHANKMSLNCYFRVKKNENIKNHSKLPIDGFRGLFLIKETIGFNRVHQCQRIFILFALDDLLILHHLPQQIVGHTVDKKIDLMLFKILQCLPDASTARTWYRMIHFKIIFSNQNWLHGRAAACELFYPAVLLLEFYFIYIISWSVLIVNRRYMSKSFAVSMYVHSGNNPKLVKLVAGDYGGR